MTNSRYLLLSPQQREIAAMYEQGMRTPQIAQAVGFTRQSVVVAAQRIEVLLGEKLNRRSRSANGTGRQRPTIAR